MGVAAKEAVARARASAAAIHFMAGTAPGWGYVVITNYTKPAHPLQAMNPSVAPALHRRTLRLALIVIGIDPHFLLIEFAELCEVLLDIPGEIDGIADTNALGLVIDVARHD